MRSPYVRLLEVDPALGVGLDPRVREEARRLATAPLVTLTEGNWSCDELLERVGKPCRYGCLVLDGLIARGVVLQDRAATELLGRGDLLVPPAPDREVPSAVYFGVVDTANVAVLDALPALTLRWPAIALALLVRAERQVERASLQHAVSQLRRAEDRIVALFWYLADRWGTREDGEVHIPLSLGHEAIAQLVGGTRPTITAALGQLARDGTLRRERSGAWMLAAHSRAAIGAGPEASTPPAARFTDSRGHTGVGAPGVVTVPMPGTPRGP